MAVWLQEILRDYFGPFNVLRYVPFRAILAIITGLVITWFLYPWLIRRLQALQIGQTIREDGPERHRAKSGTPTMGGLLIVIAVLSSLVLWGELRNPYVLLTAGIILGYTVLGFVDDWMKIVRKKGIRGKTKLLWQFIIAIAALSLFFYVLMPYTEYNTRLYFPFFRIDQYYLELPRWAYIIFGSVVIVGTSNAVNLTDGLDGLAIVPSITSASVYLVFAYLSGATFYGLVLADYLFIPYLPGINELAIIAASLIGAGMGFLWYNSYPASIFMGDVGSLPIGGILGSLAVFTKNELLSVIILGIFVVEALSVIAQTTSYKLRGKRVFRMAPIHHHYELKGWAEPKIIIRFWIISLLLGLVALASIKLR